MTSSWRLRPPAILTAEQKPSALLWRSFQWNACSVSGQGEMPLKEQRFKFMVAKLFKAKGLISLWVFCVCVCVCFVLFFPNILPLVYIAHLRISMEAFAKASGSTWFEVEAT